MIYFSHYSAIDPQTHRHAIQSPHAHPNGVSLLVMMRNCRDVYDFLDAEHNSLSISGIFYTHEQVTIAADHSTKATKNDHEPT